MTAVWTPDQLARRATIEAGGSALASMRLGCDEPLIAWATDHGLAQRIDRFTPWGNPYRLGPCLLRHDAIEAYRAHLRNSRKLLPRLGELRGKLLLCWCRPLACHGDVLLEALEASEAA